jgi:hypothetical protein
MKSFFEFMALFSLGRIVDLVYSLTKGYFLRAYIRFIDGVRSIYFLVVLTISCLLLLLTGFLLLHAALFLYLPWDTAHKILLMFILGLTYMVIPLCGLCCLQSRERWLNISGTKSMLDDLSSKNKSE